MQSACHALDRKILGQCWSYFLTVKWVPTGVAMILKHGVKAHVALVVIQIAIL